MPLYKAKASKSNRLHLTFQLRVRALLVLPLFIPGGFRRKAPRVIRVKAMEYL